MRTDSLASVYSAMVMPKGDQPIMTNHITFAQFCAAVRVKGALALCLALCMLGLGSTASAQKPRIVSFDAPGADTNPGDNNGTYPQGINLLGTVARVAE